VIEWARNVCGLAGASHASVFESRPMGFGATVFFRTFPAVPFE